MAANSLDPLRAAIDKGATKTAIPKLKKLLTKKNSADGRRLLAYGLLKDGQTNAALKELAQARAIGTSMETEMAFGRFLKGKGYAQAAMSCFETAVKASPKDYEANALISMTHRDLGNMAEMIRAGQHSLGLADAQADATGIKALPLPKSPPKFDAKNRSKNIISYSLFGDNPYYQDCAVAAAAAAMAIFPEWTCRFYCGTTIPKACVERLQSWRAQVALVDHDGAGWRGLFWRFLAFDDPKAQHIMVRDVDSPPTIRERQAVDEWLASDLPFHVIRDHPNHLEPMMAGMWGGQTGTLPPMSGMIDEFMKDAETRFADQQFLRLAIWPRVRETVLVHDRYFELGHKTSRLPDSPLVNHIGFGLPRG